MPAVLSMPCGPPPSPRATRKRPAASGLSQRGKRARAAKLSVGSDCTGLGGASLALELLVLFVEEFASDIAEHARTLIGKNFSPKKIYQDVAKRRHEETACVELYSAGFPCISWSAAGKGEGLSCQDGLVGLHCLRLIECKKPTCFLLENVPNMASSSHATEFEMMLNFLKGIQDFFFGGLFSLILSGPCAWECSVLG